MDTKELGDRILRARELSGSSQAALAEKVGVDRSAIGRIEQDQRKVTVNELLAIAEALGRPLSYFVAPSVPAVVSRRSSPSDAHESSILLDEELRAFASDVQEMLYSHVVSGVDRASLPTTRYSTHDDTEHSADSIRTYAGLDAFQPISELGAFCEGFGLVTYAASLLEGGPDGACVEVSEVDRQLGVAVINGQAMSGRRRMTLAHELGHWLTGDAYDRQAPIDSEPLLQSFAIHLLAPRAGVKKVWDSQGGRTMRDRAIAVCAAFRLSWSAGLGQLRNIGLIAAGDFERLKDSPLPRAGEFARLRLVRHDEPLAPWLSPGFTAAVLDAYTAETLTVERTTELLRGTIGEDELPPIAELTFDSIRGSFTDHTV